MPITKASIGLCAFVALIGNAQNRCTCDVTREMSKLVRIRQRHGSVYGSMTVPSRQR